MSCVAAVGTQTKEYMAQTGSVVAIIGSDCSRLSQLPLAKPMVHSSLGYAADCVRIALYSTDTVYV
jgi:hypothetical protein